MRLPWALLICAFVVFAMGTSVAASVAKPSEPPDFLVSMRKLAEVPEPVLDVARAKLAIDRMIDPNTDVPGTLRQLDTMAEQIKALFPPEASRRAKLVTLLEYLYQPGPWNHSHPFSYDLDDPFGKDLRNKLLSTYLATRKGNCISMPILFVILAQRVGLEATLATAPAHVFAMVRDDNGQFLNVEATSGGTKASASYQREFAITPLAMQSGIYLQSFTKRESVAVMMGTLMEFYSQEGKHGVRLAMADIALSLYPNDVSAMLHFGSAAARILKERYGRYSSAAELTPEQIDDYNQLSELNYFWYQRAEALGWRQETPEQDAAYEQSIQRVKAAQAGGR